MYVRPCHVKDDDSHFAQVFIYIYLQILHLYPKRNKYNAHIVLFYYCLLIIIAYF